MRPPSLPSYKKLATLFTKMKSTLHPSQTHGLLCGYLCITPDAEKSEWALPAILNTEENKPALATLSDLYKASYRFLKQFSFEFKLVLPSDDVDLNTRVEALGLWCQGFLIGIEQSSLKNSLEKDAAEALHDLAEISQINFGNIPENEEDETAYFELVEFTRLAAVMIFNALHAAPLPHAEGSLIH